ncbi:ABC transporter permease, partial [Pseudomonas syringae pv. tagetis]
MANRHGKGLLGGSVVIALLAQLINWIGIRTIKEYLYEQFFYLQSHHIQVMVSMLS